MEEVGGHLRPTCLNPIIMEFSMRYVFLISFRGSSAKHQG